MVVPRKPSHRREGGCVIRTLVLWEEEWVAFSKLRPSPVAGDREEIEREKAGLARLPPSTLDAGVTAAADVADDAEVTYANVTDDADVTDIAHVIDITDVTDAAHVTDAAELTDVAEGTRAADVTDGTDVTHAAGVTNMAEVTDVAEVTDTADVTNAAPMPGVDQPMQQQDASPPNSSSPSEGQVE